MATVIAATGVAADGLAPAAGVAPLLEGAPARILARTDGTLGVAPAVAADVAITAAAGEAAADATATGTSGEATGIGIVGDAATTGTGLDSVVEIDAGVAIAVAGISAR